MHGLVDTHAHLDEIEDLDLTIERAKDAGLMAIIAVGIDYKSNYRTLEISEKYKGFVFAALGMHPQEIGKANPDIERTLQFIEDNIYSAVAVGEIGLDYHKKVISQAGKETQQQVLRDTLAIAKHHSKPISLHSRYSWRDCLSCVQETGIKKAVFHWFTGPMNVFRDVISEGYFASATLATQYHEEHRRVIKETPLESLLLETDSPVVYRWNTEQAHPSEPADISGIVLGKVADLKGVELDIIARQTSENALKLFPELNWE